VDTEAWPKGENSMRSDFETIAVSRHDDHILLVTLDRPNVSNALNTRMGLDLTEVFEQLAIDLEDLRVAIITGRGDKAFCAGGDLKERNGMTDESWRSQHLIFERMVRAMMACPIPLLAAVNGAAYGGGCEIAAASDFIYASNAARFALTEVTLGIARRIAANGPVAVRQAKQAIHRGLQMSVWDGLAFEIEAYNRLVSTEDRREGVLAFNERRKPVFRGR
jgi:enoyl-CoA hydratase